MALNFKLRSVEKYNDYQLIETTENKVVAQWFEPPRAGQVVHLINWWLEHSEKK